MRPMKRLNWILIPMVLLYTLSACVVQEPREAQVNREALRVQADNSGQNAMSSRDATRAAPRARGQLLVRFQDGTEAGEIQRIQQAAGLRVLKLVSPPRLYLMEITDGSAVDDMLERLKQYSEIVHAEPNYVRTLKEN